MSTRGWRSRVPRAFATALTVVAVLCALAAIGGVFHVTGQPVRQFIDNFIIAAPANLAYALLVALIAAAVARRKRVAYVLLQAYFLLQIGTGALTAVAIHFVGVPGTTSRIVDTEDGFEYPPWLPWATGVSIVIAIAAMAVLAASRREFYAKTRRASFASALLTLGVVLAAGITVGYVLVRFWPGTVAPEARLAYAANKVLGSAFPDVNQHAPGWVQFLLGLFGAVALFGSFIVLFRAQRLAAVLNPEDEAKIRTLLAEHGGRDSLGYFATRRDKAVIFSESGKAAVTYRVVAGVCLASGDPIGDRDAWRPAIQAWLATARQYAWIPAVIGTSEQGATEFHRAGLKVLELGDEAIIDVRQFSTAGPDMGPVRQAVNRIERAGYTARVRRHADIAADEMAQMVALAERWRDTKVERGFSMALSRLGDPTDGRCVLVEAVDQDGVTTALLSFVPWGERGLSLDLMRRDRDADNGLMEFMVTALISRARPLGIDHVSLNFAMFRSAFEEGARIGAGPVLRSWRQLLLTFSRWWQLESLYRSNVKYRPHWAPRFLCFGERRELARIGLASAIAEGFVTVPWRRRVAAPPPLPFVESLVAAPTRREPSRPEQVQVRLDKLARIRQAGGEPYPLGFDRTHHCAEIAERHPDLPPDTHTGDQVSVAGRVVLLRDHGGIRFAVLRDWSGDLQVMITAEAGGTAWDRDVDLGDLVGVRGEVITSRRGQLSVMAKDWTLTGKCLHPLPDKHRGLLDPEAKVRHRHLDLITAADARTTFMARSKVIHSLRQTLHAQDYLETETPILQRVHGGANARPFQTHMNAYDLPLYLRIAPELYLKRLLVGGVDRVFELGRTFRNEGVSFKHNPEFTMLEAYRAYADYTVMRELAETLIKTACHDALGTTVIDRPDAACDLAAPWRTITVNDAISHALGEEVTPDVDVDKLRSLAQAARVPCDPSWNHGQIVLELYERLVERTTTTPTFYLDFPTDVSPLTRQHRADPRLAERWDLVAFGMELGTAYSELTDPTEQRRRLTVQSLLAAGGDADAMQLDEDFLQTLEYAMPPTGGLGLGVDRLVMLLTGKTIRETLPFPLARPTT